jgi:hypothetical protein
MNNLTLLTTFILDAPRYDHLPQGPVIGIKGEGFQICSKCMTRIYRRGCYIPKPNQLLWADKDRLYHCDLEQFHNVAILEAA